MIMVARIHKEDEDDDEGGGEETGVEGEVAVLLAPQGLEGMATTRGAVKEL